MAAARRRGELRDGGQEDWQSKTACGTRLQRRRASKRRLSLRAAVVVVVVAGRSQPPDRALCCGDMQEMTPTCDNLRSETHRYTDALAISPQDLTARPVAPARRVAVVWAEALLQLQLTLRQQLTTAALACRFSARKAQREPFLSLLVPVLFKTVIGIGLVWLLEPPGGDRAARGLQVC